eukprot:gnl/TRDRNA2_/TRDRNA2_81277_c0_seq1.p1 gnl/TRDRNA2_/TRDRNA2_81277_c0~~gnl/TRDRNA2_/TRDRNA2_81277_c0_seq1.p1  ORF type:complete len:552 (+),score=92.91 gnl/TRDRNA2_/TRDRNA2_81277_c0_seq1:161-1816(+)
MSPPGGQVGCGVLQPDGGMPGGAPDGLRRCFSLARRTPPLHAPVTFQHSWSIQEALDQHKALTQQHDVLGEIGQQRQELRRTTLAFARLEMRDAAQAARCMLEARTSSPQAEVMAHEALQRLERATRNVALAQRHCDIEEATTGERRSTAEVKIQDSLKELRSLKEAIDDLRPGQGKKSGPQKFYCTNCKVGGHGARFCGYFLKRPNWQIYPCENWFVSKDRGQCFCPLGSQQVDFTDETYFSRISMHIKGRMWLEDKCKLWEFVPDLMPRTYVIEDCKWKGEVPVDIPDSPLLPWFVKETDRNWGTSVVCCNKASECMGLTQPGATYVVQQHIARPLLYEGRKCHIKFYNLLIGEADGQTWDLYCYKDGYLCISPTPWSPQDTSKENQVTIIRSQRIGNWEHWPVVYPKCKRGIATVVQRAVSQGKLEGRRKKQFEIISADYLVDSELNVFLLEFNTGPVLKDPQDSPDCHDGGMIDGALHIVEPWEGGNIDQWDHALRAVGAPLPPEEGVPPGSTDPGAGNASQAAPPPRTSMQPTSSAPSESGTAARA